MSVFSRFILILSAGLLLGLLVRNLAFDFAQSLASALQIIVYFVLPLFALLVCVWALWARRDIRLMLALIILSCVGATYLAEGYLWLTRDLRALAERNYEERLGRLRSVQEQRKIAKSAYPAMSPSILLNLIADSTTPDMASPVLLDGTEVLPLSGIDNTITAFCHDGQRTISYRSDRYGFLNPDHLWSLPDIAIAAVGDSFTQGLCISPDLNFISLIRNRYPATLNLGMQGNGPLAELGILKEFVREVQPKIVVWIYFEGNDLPNLSVEKDNPILIKYLDHNFS